MTTHSDILVIGRGIVGTVAAWRAVEAGLRVTCLDPEPASGATFAAAGMLAPVTEAEFGEQDLLPLNLASAEAWPAFADELQERSGHDIAMARCGILSIAFDVDDARQLARITELQRRWHLDVTELTSAQAREREPLLGPRVAAASWAPDDHQVDPRRVVGALEAVLDRADVPTVRQAAARLLVGGDGAVVGAVDCAGTEHRADRVVLAAGEASAALLASIEEVTVPVRPVKGQILRLSAVDLPWFGAARIIRGLVQQRPIYVVVRPDGEIVVGATTEELPDDRRPTAGGVFGLLRDARAVVPGLDEAHLVECTARARPATPDNLPAFGATRRAGLIVAAGHYRHGVLLAALTARGFDDLFAGRRLDAVWDVADPHRFAVKEPV